MSTVHYAAAYLAILIVLGIMAMVIAGELATRHATRHATPYRDSTTTFNQWLNTCSLGDVYANWDKSLHVVVVGFHTDPKRITKGIVIRDLNNPDNLSIFERIA